jgi:hypothetical protein
MNCIAGQRGVVHRATKLQNATVLTGVPCSMYHNQYRAVINSRWSPSGHLSARPFFLYEAAVKLINTGDEYGHCGHKMQEKSKPDFFIPVFAAFTLSFICSSLIPTNLSGL